MNPTHGICAAWHYHAPLEASFPGTRITAMGHNFFFYASLGRPYASIALPRPIMGSGQTNTLRAPPPVLAGPTPLGSPAWVPVGLHPQGHHHGSGWHRYPRASTAGPDRSTPSSTPRVATIAENISPTPPGSPPLILVEQTSPVLQFSGRLNTQVPRCPKVKRKKSVTT